MQMRPLLLNIVCKDLLYILVLGPVFDDLGGGAGHLAAELAVPLALAELLDPIGQTFFGEVVAILEHLGHIVLILIIAVLVDDRLDGEARGLGTVDLLLCGITKDQHTGGNDIIGQVEQLTMVFEVLDDIADIAGTDAQGFGGNSGILCGDQCILLGQQQIALGGVTNLGEVFSEDIHPTLDISAEDQYERCCGNERLVITALRQLGLHFGIGDIQNGQHGHIAGRGGLNGSVQNGMLIFGRDRLLGVDTDRLAVLDQFECGIHGRAPLTIYDVRGTADENC